MDDEELGLFLKGAELIKGESYETCLLVAANVYFEVENPEIIVNVTDVSYQGDSYGLVHGSWDWVAEGERNRKRFFWFNYGWGSCSGCDLLEGAGSLEVVKSFHGNSLVPIPVKIPDLSINKYIENEKNNHWGSSAFDEVLEKWEKWRKENRYDEYGRAEWLK